MDIDFNAILKLALPSLIRLGVICFSTLGVVYMLGRLLFPKITEKGKNVIAFVSLLILSFGITLVYDYGSIIDQGLPSRLWRYIVSSSVYAFIGAVFYVVLGWRFYSRMDSLLDRKIGKDNRRKK